MQIIFVSKLIPKDFGCEKRRRRTQRAPGGRLRTFIKNKNLAALAEKNSFVVFLVVILLNSFVLGKRPPKKTISNFGIDY